MIAGLLKRSKSEACKPVSTILRNFPDRPLADWITEVPAYQPPAHQSERRSQRNHLHPLNSPTHAPTSKTRDDPKAASSKTLRGTRGTRQALSTPVDVDEQHDHTSAVSTRSRTGNGTCLKRKAQVLLAGSDSEDEVPPVSSSLNAC